MESVCKLILANKILLTFISLVLVPYRLYGLLYRWYEFYIVSIISKIPVLYAREMKYQI